FDLAGLDEEQALRQMSPEEGDWMVIGPADPKARPWEILHGRLAIVQAIDGDEITAELMPMSFAKSEFRFGHNASLAIEQGERYVLDPMADDLVAHRVLDGCRNTDHNHFLAWIEGGSEAAPKRAVTGDERDALAAFHAALETADGILTPTERQG